MSNYSDFVLALLSGVLLGTFFFFGLWWTIKIIVSSKAPVFFIFSSLLLRMSITLGGFYLVSDFHSEGNWQRLSLCIIGFILARFIITKIIPSHSKEEFADAA